MVEENLIQAMKDGTVQRGSAQRLVREVRPSRNATIRIAKAKGPPYQTYIKSVPHEAQMKQQGQQAS